MITEATIVIILIAIARLCSSYRVIQGGFDIADTTSTRERFYASLRAAPVSLVRFFEGIERHFNALSGCHVYFTETNGADMRVRLGDGTEVHTPRSSVFATMTWQPRKGHVFGRCKLAPSDLQTLGLSSRSDITADAEPQLSEFRLAQDYWASGASEFIDILEAAKTKLQALNRGEQVKFHNR